MESKGDKMPLLKQQDSKQEIQQALENISSKEYRDNTKKRRPTFSGSSSAVPIIHQPYESGDPLEESPYGSAVLSTVLSNDYEVTDALGNIESRSNSMSKFNSDNHSILRDLRSYDPLNLPSTKFSARRHSSVRPQFRQNFSSANNISGEPSRNTRVRSSSSSENPFNTKSANIYNPNPSVSPSFAERWVNRQSKLGGPIGHYGSTGIEINHHTIGNTSSSSEHLHVDNSDIDFDSKPSSRRSSNASSLDDVCFPLDPLDDVQGNRVWPDLQVLEEFYEEETTRLKDEVLRETNEVNFRFNNTGIEDSSSHHSIDGNVGFSNPIVTKVDVSASHLLGNQKINETETMNGRLRPPKINPFDHKQRINNAEFLRTINYPPQIVSNNPEHFRFTYFREDLDSTVHSPTVSGLLQPGQTFSDLFLASEYSKINDDLQKHVSTSSSTKFNNSTTTSVREGTPTPTGVSDGVRPEVDSTPIPPSTSDQLLDPDNISPFWLDVLNPTEEEMKVLSKAFAIHPLTTEDIFLGETREKVELFKDYYFVCFRSFDIVQEKAKKRKERLHESKSDSSLKNDNQGFFQKMFKARRQSSAKSSASIGDNVSQTSSFKKREREIELEKFQRKSGDRHKPKNNELEPLNVYILVFRHAVLTFHFAPTPHPVNVRRRARLLREYLTVSADWIAYALIDDITDAFGPMIESIEDEVNSIEDAILSMNDSSDSDDSDSEDEYYTPHSGALSTRSARKYSRLQSTAIFDDKRSIKSISSISSRSTSSNIIEWKKKGDMLKRIGETRKRVMSLLRLLGSKADVIKGFAKRCNEQWEVAPRSEIGMYLGDIQDHIVTMVQSLNHYEKLLARSHSNYLAQINIDMTKVNNDMNDVLGKITILGTIVLPMNIVTGLWGMNVIVPGQFEDGLNWFYCITVGMFCIAFSCYIYAKRVAGL